MKLTDPQAGDGSPLRLPTQYFKIMSSTGPHPKLETLGHGGQGLILTPSSTGDLALANTQPPRTHTA